MSDKPGVVKAALIILWIQVALLAVGGCALFALNGEVSRQMGQQASNLVIFTAIYLMVYGIVLAILTANLAGGKNWARITIIVLSAIGAVSSLFSLSNSASTCGTVIGIGLAVAIIACLLNSDTKNWCAERTGNGA